MAITNWNLYDELHYSDMYFEGEPLEETVQPEVEIEAVELDLSEFDEDLSELDNYGEFGHIY